MTIKTFGVIGAGQMGGGIAQVAAMSGLDVVMNDIKTEFVEKGLEKQAPRPAVPRALEELRAFLLIAHVE